MQRYEDFFNWKNKSDKKKLPLLFFQLIVFFENLHAGVEEGVLVGFDEGGADAEAFLVGAGGDEADGGDAIVHQFAGQLTTGHLLITNSKVEAVGYGLVEVFVVNDMEAMTTENLLQLMGTLAIDADLATEIVFAIGSCSEHGSHSILGGMAGTAGEGIEHAGGENESEGQSLVTLCQVVVMAMEQLIADTGDTNALASIAEGLRT